jgi:alkanesulfonate monooxygenase SsuD/methylene tetrahydromethanopterin reductase-like flavin-dependent oxidoreductase (luciferase family)
MVQALGVIGSAASCQQQIEEFAAAGIALPIVMPFAPLPETAAYQRTIAAFQA